MSTDYQKLALKRYPRLLARKDAEARYWMKFTNTVHVKEYAAVTSIQFSPAAPYDFAVTSSARVQIYSTKTNAVKKTISRFKQVAQSASYRQDGKLLVAADESGLVQVFDLGSRAILRNFYGHTDAVRCTRFLPSNTHVLSASDDKSLRIWDISTGQVVNTWEDAHTDYIRTAAVSSSNDRLVLTGSYDHTIKLWDLRANEAVMTLTHGTPGSQSFPVESVMFLPGDAVVLSAGGNQLRAWDILGSSSGRLLHMASNHQKTITSMCLDGSSSRVLTASLDRHVKIYNVSDYKVVHSVKYPAPILSVAISPNDTHIVAGMTTGLLSIRERVHKVADQAALDMASLANPFALGPNPVAVPKSRHERDATLPGGTYKFFLRGRHKQPSEDDQVVTISKKPKLKEFEKLLRKFQYSQALDVALSSNMAPLTVVSLMEELIHRGDALRIALSGRDDVALENLMHFILRHITSPRYVDILSFVLDTIIDMYSSVIHASPVIFSVFQKIRRKTRDEIEFQKDMTRLQGIMEMLMTYSSTTSRVIEAGQ